MKSVNFAKDQFCGSTSKRVCDGGGNCKYEKVLMTKEVCDGRSITPWVSNMCDSQLQPMLPCLAKINAEEEEEDMKIRCAKEKEQLLCLQANPCYEIQPHGEGVHSYKARCDKSPCKLQCSTSAAAYSTGPAARAGTSAAAYRTSAAANRTSAAACGTTAAACRTSAAAGAGTFACVVALAVVSN